jgi:BirA family biotin operon repressor/biotin-[acetyl-CoA-carboxylase] ligase
LPAEFAVSLARVADRLAPLALRAVWYPEIGSTNDAAAGRADAGVEQGYVVLADAQTAGRGRLGRAWASPPGAGIYASVVLRPSDAAMTLLTLAAGVAIAEGIETATGLSASLKWPNDVVVDTRGDGSSGRKLAGILAERGSSSDGRTWVVLGFGINVMPGAYPAEVAGRATSLEAELGRGVDRGLLVAECLAAVAGRYRDLEAGRSEGIVAGWRVRAASTLGRRVEWDADGSVQRGIARDVDPSGALIVSTDAGVRQVLAGEVRWI